MSRERVPIGSWTRLEDGQTIENAQKWKKEENWNIEEERNKNWARQNKRKMKEIVQEMLQWEKTHYEPCLMSPYNNLSNSFGMKRERWREVKELSKREEWHKRLKNRLSENRWKRERNRFVNWSSWLNSAQIINQNESVLFLSPSYSLFFSQRAEGKVRM